MAIMAVFRQRFLQRCGLDSQQAYLFHQLSGPLAQQTVLLDQQTGLLLLLSHLQFQQTNLLLLLPHDLLLQADLFFQQSFCFSKQEQFFLRLHVCTVPDCRDLRKSLGHLRSSLCDVTDADQGKRQAHQFADEQQTLLWLSS